MRLPVGGLLVAVLLALAVAACGGNSPNATSTPGSETVSPSGTTLQLAADPTGRLEFIPTRLEAPAGKVTIVLTNDSSVEHDVAIVGNGVFAKSDRVANGGRASVTATLKPGIYEFYCTVPGHQDAGMDGVLAVT